MREVRDGDHPGRMLAELGVSVAAERLYVEVLRSGTRTLAPDRLDETAVDELVTHGLVTVSDGMVSLVPVDLAFRGWALRRDRAMDRARQRVESVAKDHDSGRYVELLRGNDMTFRAFVQLQEEAAVEICGFDRGPYIQDPALGVSEAQPGAIERGVAYRVIYDSTVISSSQLLANLRAAVEMGEEARMFPGLPMKLIIADRRVAIVLLRATGGGVTGEADTLLIHPSPMLDAVCALFDAFWRLSVPASLDKETGEERDPELRRLLELLTAGLTDKSIAAELGVSERTVQRRVYRLEGLLGAQTRFQLGVQAVRRNWI